MAFSTFPLKMNICYGQQIKFFVYSFEVTSLNSTDEGALKFQIILARKNLLLSYSNVIVVILICNSSYKIKKKKNETFTTFNNNLHSFPIVSFPFLYGDVSISQLVQFVRVCTKVYDFNDCNLHILVKILGDKETDTDHKRLKTFTKFHNRCKDLIKKNCEYIEF